jgi:muramoyltetrapeptide carboxypeptidase
VTGDTIFPGAPKEGASVALVAASGPVPEGGVERAIERAGKLGWTPVLGSGARLRTGYLAGPDTVRLKDLQGAIDSPGNELIWLLRGGYGMMRLLPHLDLTPLRDRPRPVIGFSDVTAFHLAARRLGLVTFHGPHAATNDLPAFSLTSLRTALEPRAAGILPFPTDGSRRGTTIVGGRAEGRLVGGNLALIAATLATPYQIEPAGGILFIEEVGEAAYRVDRLLTQLLLAGIFDRVAGVALGGFSERPDLDGSGYVDSLEVIGERLSPLGIPIAGDLPFGHIPNSWTLPEGVLARLDASAGTLELLEPAVVS